jgi:hypothetical protein
MFLGLVSGTTCPWMHRRFCRRYKRVVLPYVLGNHARFTNFHQRSAAA